MCLPPAYFWSWFRGKALWTIVCVYHRPISGHGLGARHWTIVCVYHLPISGHGLGVRHCGL